MSARCRDGQQNAAASERETDIETETETETDTVNVNVNETDFMLKIMTATPASTATATATLTTLTTVNAQNKCATAAPTTFSYQRAAKRCARLEQATTEAAVTITDSASATESEAKSETAAAKRQETNEATKRATTVREACANPCERQRRLAEHKAQLRAAFFKDLSELAAQQQKERHKQLREQAKAFDSTRRIQQLIEKFQAMIVQQPTEQRSGSAAAGVGVGLGVGAGEREREQQAHLKPITIATAGSAANSDEGCNAGGLSPCSSDNECDAFARRRKPKVTRCASSDSALGLEVDDVNMDVLPATPQRRMTLTVTDLPLRPALLPLAEPTALPDSPLTSPTNPTAAMSTSTSALSLIGGGGGGGGSSVGGVPSKVLLEERVVAALSAPPSSRRESTQSCISELGSTGGVRYVRTPSVVVSDYSDDITACGISMEEMEYFRLQRARCHRRCSLEASAAAAGSIGGAKDEAQSDVSAASSCSNLYYCGSTISALDGGECIVNGVRVALARKSSHSSSGDLSGGDDDAEDEELEIDVDADAEVEVKMEMERQRERERERERERQLSELLAATQLGDGFKKVCCNLDEVKANKKTKINQRTKQKT
ncbi:uncharacterized protein LOC117780661 [Drosophila innubila]|uniref:uncharacterized protein LOC117780661 n=1 Tax=Drosophila innubila TaxID=198719 RepID=UPI00148CEDB2|nr:uncharacterized protein LOC117780661 [Drosophila innubila]